MRWGSRARWLSRVLFMDGGRILEEGPAEAVINHPQHERTRAFLSAVL